jgi:aspartate carbamoyltransferase catalytic subunit
LPVDRKEISMIFKNVISISDFSKRKIYDEIIPGCKKNVDPVRKKIMRKADRRKKVVFLFIEPSTRTLGSYWEAARFLGWENQTVVGEEATSLIKKESLANTARMYGRYNTDILVVRTRIEGAQRFMAETLEEEGYDISVQNGGDGTNQHPTQTFLDILTISEKLHRLDDLKIGFWGDLKYGRTVHSLLCALALRENVSVALSSFKETDLQVQYKRLFLNIEESDSTDVLENCDIIYMSRLQEERFMGDPIALQRAKEKFRLDNRVMESFKEDVLIMHPLPYVGEITPEIRRHKNIIVDDQAWCGLPTRIFMLDEGYRSRKEKVLSFFPKGKTEVIQEIPANEYLNKKGKKSRERHRYFSPITEGTVIDHLPKGLGFKIMSFVSGKLGERGVRHTIENVPSKRYLYKDVLVIENTLLPEEVMVGISSLAPSATFNLVDKKLFRKVKVTGSQIIVGIGKCPNVNCITNNDPEAVYKFVYQTEGPQCYYCEKQFSREEILA